MNNETKWKPTKAWWDWYLSPPVNYRELYGDAFKWTAQEKMLMQQLTEKNSD